MPVLLETLDTSEICCSTLLTGWLLMSLPAYRLGQSYPLLSLHYYGWSMPIVSQCCVMSDAHTKGLVVSESDPHTGRFTMIKRLRLYSPLLYSCFTPKLKA